MIHRINIFIIFRYRLKPGLTIYPCALECGTWVPSKP